MNFKKIRKVASIFFAIGIIFACVSTYYHNLYEKISHEIKIKKDEIISKEFPEEKIIFLYEQFIKDTVNKRTKNFSPIEKEMELGKQRVQSAISKNRYNALNEDIRWAEFLLSRHISKTIEKYMSNEIQQKYLYIKIYKNIAIAAALTLLISALLAIFSLIAYMKNKVEKTNTEERIGFLLIITSLCIAISFQTIYIINKDMYKENMWILIVCIALLAAGVAMYFSIASSIINWVKIGNTNK